VSAGKPLSVEPLSKSAFAPFGDVIEFDGAETRSINEGFATRFHDLARIEPGAEGRAILSLFKAVQRPFPITIGMLERHPLGSQAFYPLSRDDWLVVVAEGSAAPDLATLRCFKASGEQGVNYAAGTWHFPVLILVPSQSFLVVDRAGPGANLEEFAFPDGASRTIDVAR
jgi:ureidoglycolate lyase